MDEEAEQEEQDLAKPVEKLIFLKVCLLLFGAEMRRERERNKENACVCMCVCVYVCF